MMAFETQEQPLVSIVINNYNYGRFVAQAIESALGQSYPHVEVIVVDDGSTDGSQAIIGAYRDRILPILKPNGGQASALNAGFARSRGDIVIFLDADDTLHTDTVERVVQAFAPQPQPAVVQYRLALVDADGAPLAASMPPAYQTLPEGDLRRHALAFPDDLPRPPTSGNAFAVDVLRQILPMPEDEYRICADFYLSNMAPLFGPVAVLDEPGGLYRTHGANHHHTSTLDLRRTQQIVDLSHKTHQHLQRAADALALTDEADGTVGASSVTYLAHCMTLARLEPHRLPPDAGSPLDVLRLGIAASLGRFDLSALMRLVYVAWFVAAALAPRRLMPALSQAFFHPESRGRLNNLLGLLQPGSRSGAAGASLRRIAVGSSHLFLASILSSVIGYVYWLVAARTYSPSDVGHVSALISVMYLVAELAGLGLGAGLAYVLPTARERWAPIVHTVAGVIAVVAAAVSALFLIAGAALQVEIAQGVVTPRFVAFFALLCAGWALGLLMDQVLMIEHRTSLIIVRNLTASVARVAMLAATVMLAWQPPLLTLVAGWGLSTWLGLLVTAALFARDHRDRWAGRWSVDPGAVRRLLPLSLRNYALSTTELAASQLLPIIVATAISTDASAYYYVASTMATMLFLLPASIAKSFFARGALSGALDRDDLLRVLGLTLAFILPLVAAVVLTRSLLLGIFGASYAENGSGLLAILALTALPLTVVNLYGSAMRAARRFGRAAVVAVLILVLTLSLVYLGILRFGLLGVGLGFGLAYTLVAALCLGDLLLSQTLRSGSRTVGERAARPRGYVIEAE